MEVLTLKTVQQKIIEQKMNARKPNFLFNNVFDYKKLIKVCYRPFGSHNMRRRNG